MFTVQQVPLSSSCIHPGVVVGSRLPHEGQAGGGQELQGWTVPRPNHHTDPQVPGQPFEDAE